MERISRVRRSQLFPDEAAGPKADREYFQVFVRELEKREPPIVSRRLRRVVFIPTTWHKLVTATELNDLFDDSPLEDALWSELKRLGIPAERQYDVVGGGRNYRLDFAVYCRNGKLDIETDGDTWHADPDRIPEDNRRNNALAARGWHVLRFNGLQVRETMSEYCVGQIADTVNRLGGVADADPPRTYHSTDEGVVQQFTLFPGAEQTGQDDEPIP